MGAGYKQALREQANRKMILSNFVTQLPLETNRVDLEPDLKDAWGLPAMRITMTGHPDDIKSMESLSRSQSRFFRPRGRPQCGQSRRARLAEVLTAVAPAEWGTIRSRQSSTSTIARTMSPTCTSWTAAASSPVVAITPRCQSRLSRSLPPNISSPKRRVEEFNQVDLYGI